MANHIRQQIREQIATTVTGLSTTGSNVYQSRVYPLNATAMPALIVYTVAEASEPDVMGSTLVSDRRLTVAIEAYVKGTTNFDDSVDTICKEVEVAIAGDITVNGLAKFIYLASTDISYNGDSDQPVGVVTMTYNVQYRTGTTTPDVAA